MRSRGLPFILALAAAPLVGCDTRQPLEPARVPDAVSMAKGRPPAGNEFATVSQLPAIKGANNAGANAVNQGGSIIAGYSWDRTGRMIPTTWTLQNGAWTLTALPYAASASSAIARAVNDQGDVAGNDFPANTPHAVLWPSTGGFNVLGCGELGDVYGISAGGRILVGNGRGVAPGTNAAGEVVGLSTLTDGTGTAFFWSETLGMRELPVTGGAWAYGVSAVRSDGTRLVVGTGGSRSGGLVWVVRNP